MPEIIPALQTVAAGALLAAARWRAQAATLAPAWGDKLDDLRAKAASWKALAAESTQTRVALTAQTEQEVRRANDAITEATHIADEAMDTAAGYTVAAAKHPAGSADRENLLAWARDWQDIARDALDTTRPVLAEIDNTLAAMREAEDAQATIISTGQQLAAALAAKGDTATADTIREVMRAMAEAFGLVLGGLAGGAVVLLAVAAGAYLLLNPRPRKTRR